VCQKQSLTRAKRKIFAGVCLNLLRIDGSFLHSTEKAQEVARGLLKKIIPPFEIPVSIGSDNGPTFVVEVVQLMARRLEIT
jgi:hypothetical protein